MDLNKISAGENPNKVNAIIEIPYGSNIKYHNILITKHFQPTI